MKKIALALIATILMTGAVMAQAYTKNQGYVMGYVIPTQTTPTTEYIKKNSFVYITADTTLYLTKINIGVGSRMSTTMLASAGNYSVINRAIFGGKAISFFVDTANAQNIYGVKSFKNNTVFSGTTVTIPGGTTISKTAGNANSATLSGSLVVGGNDTLTTTHVATTSATVGTTLTLPGSTTITKTPGNANSITTSGSLVVGGNDTLTTTHVATTSVGATSITSATLVANTSLRLGAVDTTETAVLGKIVFKDSDKAFYGCKSLTGKKWYKLDN